MFNKQFEEFYKDVSFFYRDTCLDDEYISLYKVGLIIEEKGYCDLTFKGGGVMGNLRFLVTSNKGKELSLVDPNVAQYGFILLTHNSFFRVLDVFSIKSKTQILLLDISNERNGYIDNRDSSFEKELIELSRGDFEEKLMFPIVESLDTDYWKNRTKKPIGMFPFTMRQKWEVNYV